MPVAAKKVEIGIDVVVSRDGIEDEVEAAGVLCHLVRIAGDDYLVGAKTQSVFLLVGRSGEEDDVSSEGVGELDPHVAQSAEPDDADLLALGDSPVVHGRVRGDSGAEQRRGSGEVEVRGNLEHEFLVDDDAVRVAAVSNAAAVLVRGVVGQGEIGAELFQPLLALGAGAVGVDHAADSREIAGLEFGNGRAGSE